MFADLKNKKAISPIITTILLVVVGVILITVVLNFGKNFTTKSLDQTTNFGSLKVSDATNFVYPKYAKDGVLQINYAPPVKLENESITITQYQLLDVLDSEVVTLQTPVTLNNNSLSTIQLDCLYEYALSKPDFTIQLITAQNTYIEVKLRDPNMVCSPGGTGTIEDPIIVCNAEDLNAMRLGLDANYALGKDIDLYCFSRRDEDGWAPIGENYSTNGFNGYFDGQNHTISNLYINTNKDDVGLFGYIAYNEDKTIEIKNLILKDVNITGDQKVGSITGNFANLAAISNVQSSGSISGSSYVGGLIGVNTFGGFNNIGGDLNFSSFTGQINASEDYIGGLIGNNLGTIENSNSNATISASRNYVGGITGSNGGYIRKTYSEGSIISSGNYVGGLVGNNSKEIYDSYSLCTVSGEDSVGGLAGQNFKPFFPPGAAGGKIYSSYSAGEVTGESNAGGLVGLNTNALISLSVYDTNNSGQSDIGKGDPKTTAEMKTPSTYTDWDFITVWAIHPSKNNGYPYLRWQN